MSDLREVIISITTRCNCACRMCDIPMGTREELTCDQIRQVIEDARLLGASTIVLSGGEPLLHKDIFSLIALIKKNAMNACITSNGLLIDNELAAQLKNTGIDVVNISLEGPRDVHDSLRGKGTYDKALSALRYLRENKVETTIAAMISHCNYSCLPHVIEVAGRYGVTTIKFQPFNPLFLNDAAAGKEFSITQPEDLTRLQEILNEVKSLCREGGIVTNPSPYLDKIPGYFRGDHSEVLNGKCGALWATCSITSRGVLYPCWVLTQDEYLIGDVKEKRLIDLWDSQKHQRVRQAIVKKGCHGCMMSCYDGMFGQELLTRRLMTRVNEVKHKGIGGLCRRQLKQWARRIKFYLSYRGTPKDFIRKLKIFILKKNNKKYFSMRDDIKEERRELEAVKKMISRELARMR